MAFLVTHDRNHRKKCRESIRIRKLSFALLGCSTLMRSLFTRLMAKIGPTSCS